MVSWNDGVGRLLVWCLNGLALCDSFVASSSGIIVAN